MNTRTPLALAPVAALNLAVGAASLPAAQAAQPPAQSQSCFWGRDVDNFTSPDNRTVYLRVGMRRVYEVRLFSPCIDIGWVEHIVLRSRGSNWICEGTGHSAEIITLAEAGRQRCQVDSVRKMTAEEVSALPKRFQP